MLSSADIRKTFLDFFISKGHHIVPSAPIVVKNDPTLMFTNAGMNQFKDFFLGNKKPSFTRIADTQKCLRVSGKHNDLEEVGVDTYHHTMFEMLGNWSFGDYFKKEAIEWSWELLTEKLNIPKDRLYVTVFQGSPEEGIEKDEEAISEWKKWIDPDRILQFGKKDNFWEMGDTGPCGPCTEIHVDTRSDEERKKINGKDLVNADHPLVIEIWNNVFIQYNRLKDGSLQQLPAKHVDTGMGFERLVRVLQQKQSNYDTDIFMPTIRKIESITGKKYEATETGKADIAFRVLSDHIRAICFTIADGQLPSNTGAGYVIRRILRRAVRYYYSYLGYPQPLLNQLVGDLASGFENVFPELKQQQAFVTKVIREEEESFLRTLEKGLKRIEDIISSSKGKIEGSNAFELYDTYGFPIDLTRLIAAERNIEVDEAGFTAEMQKQKDRSRAATATDASDWIVVNEGDKVEFVGYDSLETKAHILKYRSVKAKGKELVQVVLDKTPFYAESGGQVGDTGTLKVSGNSYRIIDTKKENDLIIHFLEHLPAEKEIELTAVVDSSKRKKTALHHSATHLLHAALRKVLGAHVAQKGSLVNADYLRFDFSHFSKMTNEEIAAVEKIVNSKIRENHPVVIRELPKEEAMKLGAMALFGEKYGDTVRVVTIDPDYSIELCGGTHVASTGELGFFKITSEGAVAAGVRRIEALCGEAAEHFINSELEQLKTAKDLLKNPKDISAAIGSIQNETSQLKKKLEKYEAGQVKQLKQDLLNKIDKLNEFRFIGQVVDAGSAETLKKLALELTGNDQVVVLAAAIEGKAVVAIGVGEAVINKTKLDAPTLIREKVAPLIKGGGGGQKTLATAGGTDVSSLQQVIEAVKTAL
jgi:alanyl-tRNA synthetase